MGTNTEYTMNIAGMDCVLPLCKIGEDLQIGAFVMFGQPKLTVHVAKELLKKAPEFDVMLTAESKGIPLIHEMARQSGAETYVVARKKPKLYMRDIHTVTVRSITTVDLQQLCLSGDDCDLIRGRRVLIVDDVISTGESLRSMETLVNDIGGNIVGKMAVLAEGEAADREDIICLEKLPLFHADGTPIE